MKRALDIAFAIAVLVVALPIIALCAIAIKIDSLGPVFFFQKRTGQHGRPIRMYKLRTMVADAESTNAELAHANERTGLISRWPAIPG